MNINELQEAFEQINQGFDELRGVVAELERELGPRWLKGILEVAEGKRQAADLIAEMTEAKE